MVLNPLRLYDDPKETLYRDYNFGGGGMDWLGLGLLLGPALGGLFSESEPSPAEMSYLQDPEYRKRAREWAEQFAGEYPEFPGLPGQADIMGTRLSEMLGGELSPAVQKYLTAKYQQAWTSALPHYADIGVDPGTLASQRIRLGERQAIEGGYLGQQQIGRAMELMPQYTQMMMSPYMMDVMKWQNISNLIGENFPGAPYTAPGTTPTTPISTPITTYPRTKVDKWGRPTGPSGPIGPPGWPTY